MQLEETYLKLAISKAFENIDNNGGPFGAAIVFNGKVISLCSNTVTIDNDPTAHAEINAIREASKVLKTFDLSGCTLYSSCEPCPMCISAIYWSHIDKVIYASTTDDAKQAGFDDTFIYDEIQLPKERRKISFVNILQHDSKKVFEKWKNKKDKIPY